MPRTAELKVEVPAELAPGSRLTLVDGHGRPPLPLRLSGRGDVPLSRSTNTLRLPPGGWTVTLVAGDGRTWSAQVSLQPGQTTELALGGP